MKKAIGITLGTLTTLLAALPVYAATVNPCQGALNASLCTPGTQIGVVIGRVVTFLIVLAVIIALFFLIWGGIRWILSGGDKAKVEGARNAIIGAIIGMVIAFLSYFILSFVLSLFGLSLTNLTFSRILG